MKFNKAIKGIHENNEFFNIDYDDVVKSFDTDDNEEKVMVSMRLSLVNVAFLDSVRGIISRPRYVDRILDIYRNEFIEDVKNRVDKDNNDKVE